MTGSRSIALPAVGAATTGGAVLWPWLEGCIALSVEGMVAGDIAKMPKKVSGGSVINRSSGS